MNERGLLPGELAVLGVLAIRPMHGYEMVCFFSDEGINSVCPVEQSTLYTYLRNVEARGLVTWTEERVGQRPPRKTFELTKAGRDLVDEWMRRPVGRIREIRLEFLLKLFFLKLLDPAALRILLSEQIRTCDRYLEAIRGNPADTEFERLVALSKASAAEATLGWLKAYANELDLEVSG